MHSLKYFESALLPNWLSGEASEVGVAVQNPGPGSEIGFVTPERVLLWAWATRDAAGQPPLAAAALHYINGDVLQCCSTLAGAYSTSSPPIMTLFAGPGPVVALLFAAFFSSYPLPALAQPGPEPYTSYDNVFVDPHYILSTTFNSSTKYAQQSIVTWAEWLATQGPYCKCFLIFTRIVVLIYTPSSGSEQDHHPA